MKVTEKHNDKRKSIMEASLKLFGEKCVQDTSTASISQEANVGTGTLFCYFDSKEDLVNALYLESKEELAVYIEAGVWEQTTFKTQLKHIWDRTIEWYIENPRKIKFMWQFRSSPLITKITHEKAVMRFTVMADVVKKAIASGEATTASAELLTSLISGYFHSAGMYLLDNAHNKNIKAWQEETFTLLWKGIH
ncbi:MAG: Transcriptional regulator, TetR family [Bacteroidota bacterium]|nr:Transcriptional regulator, TetR family [Bacteroidota bacterium]